MVDDTPKMRPGITPASEAERAARQAREAAALRENLKKRRLQTQSRKPALATKHEPDPCP
jgi:hypothetical protein